MGARDPFTSLKPKRISDSAVDQIVALINNGTLPPGARLPPERDLVKRLGVSRNSLREAIRILETMGLLSVAPGRGTWVREDVSPAKGPAAISCLPPNSKDAADLLEMRETLEVKAAALAAERGREEDTSEIRRRLQALQTAISQGDPELIIAADAGFHEAVADASGNRILADSLQSLSALVVETRRMVVSLPGRLRRMWHEHEAITLAIAAGDPEGAARAMFNHVRRVAEELEAAASRDRILQRDEQRRS